MKSRKKQVVIYQLIVEDLQTVADQVLNRNLTAKEIEKIKDLIGEKINWFDAIADTIYENIDIN